jgi:hypothetical protein
LPPWRCDVKIQTVGDYQIYHYAHIIDRHPVFEADETAVASAKLLGVSPHLGPAASPVSAS